MVAKILLSAVVVLSGMQQGLCATLHLTGDSTCAIGGTGRGTQGWGAVVQPYLSLDVVDHAIAGTSARSYTRDGHFAAVATQVKKGDTVVIEFGHNDGGGLNHGDNGRADCGGDGRETCQTTFKGVKETVQTFPTYLVLATHLFQSKGAQVIISSTTPDNPMTAAGKVDYQPSRFVSLAQKAAKDANVTFVDHGYAVAQAYEKLSAATVNSFFPLDRVHTSPAGAKVVAESFVRALETTHSDLKKSIKAGTVPAL